MHAEDLSGKLDLAWGDPQAWTANGLQWLHLPEVQATIRRRVTGYDAVAPNAVLGISSVRHRSNLRALYDSLHRLGQLSHDFACVIARVRR